MDPIAVVFTAMLVPWMGAGLADWACHRASDIAHTPTGLRENVLHWVMFAETGALVAALVLLQPTAGLLALGTALFLLHQATVWVDLRLTAPVRTISPVEQMVHSVQEMLPVVALVLLVLRAWDQVLALAGQGGAGAPEWALRWAGLPPLAWLALLGAAVLVVNVLPLAQETLACLRARTRPSPAPR